MAKVEVMTSSCIFIILLLCIGQSVTIYQAVIRHEVGDSFHKDYNDTVHQLSSTAKNAIQKARLLYGDVGSVNNAPGLLHLLTPSPLTTRPRPDINHRLSRGVKRADTGSYAQNKPEQIHISYGDRPNEMVIMWSMPQAGTSIVCYGKTSWNLNLQAEGTCERLVQLNTRGLQFIHRVLVKELVPDQMYYYLVQTDSFQSEVISFTTMKAGNDWTPTLYIFGDMGRFGGAPSLRILNRAAINRSVDAIIHVGDFAYDLHTSGGQVGDDFMNRIQYTASRIPYMTCVGNHEIAESTFIHYRYRFSMPGLPWPTPINDMWYSFNMGPVHFVSYSTEVYFTNGAIEKQRKWLHNDLSNANQHRDVRPWVIAFGHRPMYCSNNNKDDCTGKNSLVRAGLEKLFYTLGVDIIVQAHEHSYERFWPMFEGVVTQQNYINAQAPVHIIGGSAGCNQYDGVCVNPVLGPRGPWSAFRAWLPGLYGVGKVTIANGTHIHWQQVLAVNGQSLDQVWMEQHHHGPFPHHI